MFMTSDRNLLALIVLILSTQASLAKKCDFGPLDETTREERIQQANEKLNTWWSQTGQNKRDQQFTSTYFGRNPKHKKVQTIQVDGRELKIETWLDPSERSDSFTLGPSGLGSPGDGVDNHLTVNGEELIVPIRGQHRRGEFDVRRASTQDTPKPPMEITFVTNKADIFPRMTIDPAAFARSQGMSREARERYVNAINEKTNTILVVKYPNSGRTHYFPMEY